MKTKILIAAVCFGAAVMSANAGVRVGISIGFPRPIAVLPPVCVAPAASVPVAPVIVTPAVPACPAPGYVWVPGYSTYGLNGRVWVPGSWSYRPHHPYGPGRAANDQHRGPR